MSEKQVGETPTIISIDHPPGEATASAFIAKTLGAEVAAQFGPRDETPLSLHAHEAGALVGGLEGSSHWGWLYIRQLWVAQPWRGRGLGRRLLEQAQAQARARHCVGIYLDTFDPAAENFYLACGFERFGRIDNFPPGHTRRFLCLTLKRG